MSAPLPLTEPQERRLAATLAELERRLARLGEALDRAPDDRRLARYEDRIRADETAALRLGIAAAQSRLCQMADTLGLDRSTESERRMFVAGLELASISLHEARPSREMRGYGEVAPAAAAYLDKELPQLEALVREIIHQLERGARPKTVEQRGQRG